MPELLYKVRYHFYPEPHQREERGTADTRGGASSLWTAKTLAIRIESPNYSILSADAVIIDDEQEIAVARQLEYEILYPGDHETQILLHNLNDTYSESVNQHNGHPISKEWRESHKQYCDALDALRAHNPAAADAWQPHEPGWTIHGPKL